MTRRGKVRLWLLVGFIPFAVAGIWFGVKLMSLQVITGDSIAAFDEGDYAGSERQIDGLVGSSPVESWIPYFDRGDARVGESNVTAAIDDFEKALELAPLDRQCMVGLNLASAWEELGDSYEQSGSHDGAVQLYANAQKVLDGLGAACADSGQQDELQQQGETLQFKSGMAQSNAQDQDQDQGDGSDSDDKLDQLGQKQDQSDQDKQNDESRERAPYSSGGTDKPW